MRILIIGGTRFIGPRVAEHLLTVGHELTLFHRGQPEADLPGPVNYIYGDRRDLSSFKSQLKETIEWERVHPPDQADGSRFDYAAEDAALKKLSRDADDPRRSDS